MSTFSFSGSGIDTTTLVTQLMQVAARPQTQLKTQLSSQQTMLSAYQGINSKFTALQAAADAVKDTTVWKSAAASSSAASVIASATTGAQTGAAITFDVTRLATAQISTVPVSGDVVADFTQGIDVLDGKGVNHHLDLTDGSAATVAAAVNSAGIGIRASLVNVDNAAGTGTSQVLQFASTSSGTSNAFTVSGLSAAPKQLVAAQNAQITVGDPAAGGYTISSDTNTFRDVLPGVTFTVSSAATGVTVSTASDTTAITSAMQALVDAANSALGQVGMYTGKGAVLQGNSQVANLKQSILSSVSHGSNTGTSLNTIGINLTATGSITFDATAFAAAYAADPAATQASAAASLATTLSAVSAAADTPVTGTISQLISSGNDQVANLNKQISAWETRLADTETSMNKKYTAMNVALSKLSSQSSWLTSALASMDASHSSSNK